MWPSGKKKPKKAKRYHLVRNGRREERKSSKGRSMKRKSGERPNDKKKGD